MLSKPRIAAYNRLDILIDAGYSLGYILEEMKNACLSPSFITNIFKKRHLEKKRK